MGHGCHECGCPNGCECPRPNTGTDGVPYCSLGNCPQYDGKRCGELGFAPHAVCVPGVIKLVTKLKSKAFRNEHEAKLDSSVIPMLLWCPECANRHIDDGEFATKAHHTHACQECGHVWRPAIQMTVGVRFLPGFRNEVPSE